MTTLFNIWVGMMALIGAGTIWLIVAIVRDYVRRKKYELEQKKE